jgi:anaerobic magnesium-protoporphyrin IX monomethyl ester cyclase
MAEQEVWHNLGTRKLKPLREANYPDVGTVLRSLPQKRPEGAVDVMLVNPPAPDGGIWIRSQHRVGRRSRENMIWSQVSLAQLAAMLHPDYKVEVVDAIATRMTWHEFEQLLREKQPKYYLTQVTAPTLTNDMYGVFLARSLGARTIAFGTHVTPMVGETIGRFPALDFVLRGEPELTLRELVDTLEVANGRWQVIDGRLQGADGRIADQEGHIYKLLSDMDPTWRPAWSLGGLSAIGEQPSAINHQLSAIKGLGWRRNGEIVANADRPFIANLDDLPMPMHHLLPLDEYRIPMIKGPYTFVVTSRGCTAGCKYCIKHVTYQYSVRVRSPENIMQELWLLHDLGIHNIHMYADMFTVSRDQVVGLCRLIIEQGLKVRWTCNSRVDYVDEEMLQLMGKAGCWMISWGIESASEEILRRARKGAYPDKVERALRWSKEAGIGNWGYFIIGLPGETEETIRQTIDFAKRLPLDLALFHIAAPYPGTPFFFDVLENGWFRPGTAWEEVDMDRSTVLDYHETGLTAERLEYWQKRATREWALRPGPIWTMLKGLNSWAGFKSAVDIGLQTLSFVRR